MIFTYHSVLHLYRYFHFLCVYPIVNTGHTGRMYSHVFAWWTSVCSVLWGLYSIEIVVANPNREQVRQNRISDLVHAHGQRNFVLNRNFCKWQKKKLQNFKLTVILGNMRLISSAFQNEVITIEISNLRTIKSIFSSE